MIGRAKYVMEQGDIAAAHKDCTAAIALDPRCVPAYALRAQLWGHSDHMADDEDEDGEGGAGELSEGEILMSAAKDALSGEKGEKERENTPRHCN
jgi:hypothetical protein